MILQPAEEFIAGVESDNHAVLSATLGEADHATLTLVGTRMSVSPGKSKREITAAALGLLGDVRIEAMLVAKSWIVANARNQLVIRFHVSERVRGFLADNRLLSQRLGRWEDLALFRRNGLLAWSCTHEEDIVVGGRRDWLLEHGLAPRRSAPLTVEAEPLDSNTVQQILASVSTVTKKR